MSNKQWYTILIVIIIMSWIVIGGLTTTIILQNKDADENKSIQMHSLEMEKPPYVTEEAPKNPAQIDLHAE